MFAKIKRFFDMGLYSKEQVYKFFEKGAITEEDYQSILNAADWLEKGFPEDSGAESEVEA